MLEIALTWPQTKRPTDVLIHTILLYPDYGLLEICFFVGRPLIFSIGRSPLECGRRLNGFNVRAMMSCQADRTFADRGRA